MQNVFAKFISKDEAVFFEGRILKNEDTVCANPGERELAALGYKPFVEESIPDVPPEIELVPVYRETEDAVILSYKRKEDAI